MQYFKRKKVKLSLIDDYIKIIIVNNFYKNPINQNILDNDTINLINKIKLISENLKIKYDEIFEKLKLNDLSLLILKKELHSNNSIYNSFLKSNFNNIQPTLIKIESTLKNILSDFQAKAMFLKCL